MMAVRQDEPNGPLYTTSVALPHVEKGEVLVKMGAAPINPSDIGVIRGTYLHRPNYPITPGIEGSGVVVASGGGFLANFYVGKRVICSSTSDKGGTWAEYMITSAMKVIPLKKSIDLEKGAMLIVNPMTALAFIEIAKRGKHKTIVNTAAASVLGQMLIKLCKKEKIELINIVRRPEQVELLKEIGARYVLNSELDGFENELKSLSDALNASLFLDAIAGSFTSKLLTAAPNGSTIVVYANLSREDITIDPRFIIQGDKKIGGFYLGNYTTRKSIVHTLKTAAKIQQLVGSELNSKVQKQYALQDINEALDFYTQNMTGGKVLFVMKA